MLRFVPASGGTQFVEFEITVDDRVSGDRRDGIYVAAGLLPKYSAHGRWYLSEATVADNANNIQYGYGFPDGRVGAPEPVVGEESLYFVNGKDSGPIVVPEATPPRSVEPGRRRRRAADREEGNELRLPPSAISTELLQVRQQGLSAKLWRQDHLLPPHHHGLNVDGRTGGWAGFGGSKSENGNRPNASKSSRSSNAIAGSFSQ
ncbi:MAG: hypothetical protein IPK16_30775 [Anaerolineales bacterium]|nr:hypothetical protein [Anaerolineales bacterium]